MSLDQLLKGFQMFNQSMSELAVNKATNDAITQLNTINSTIADDTEKQQQASMIGNQLALRLTGAGADAGQIAAATQGLVPSASSVEQGQTQRDVQRISGENQLKNQELIGKQNLQLQQMKNDALGGKASEQFSKFMIGQVDAFAKAQKDQIAAVNQIDSFKKILDTTEGNFGKVLVQRGILKLAGDSRISDQDLLLAENDPSVRGRVSRALKLNLTGDALQDEKKFYSAVADALQQNAIENIDAAAQGEAKSKASLNDNIDEQKYLDALRMKIPALQKTGKAPQGAKKQISKKQYSPSRNQTKLIYSDGSEEIVQGKQ